jgi:hypothetical protein
MLGSDGSLLVAQLSAQTTDDALKLRQKVKFGPRLIRTLPVWTQWTWKPSPRSIGFDADENDQSRQVQH